MTQTVPTPSEILELMPFAAHLGMRFEEVTRESVVACQRWAPEHCTVGGALHGGALTSLADTAAGVLAYLNVPAGGGTSTVELKVNFFRAARSGTVRATSRLLHRGALFIVVQTDLTDESGHLVAQCTQTQAVLAPRP
jgi:uncharacterized protein (TIGR00369 family)